MNQQRFRCRALRRSGVTEVRVIQAASEEVARERLLAAGLEPVSIEAVGPSLFDGVGNWRLPRWRHFFSIPPIVMPAQPARIAIGLLASIPVIVAIGSWTLAAGAGAEAEELQAAAAPTGRADLPYLSQAARHHLAVGLSRPTLSDIVRRTSAILPQSASLGSASMGADGQLTITIETPDPDRLRPAIAADRLLSRLSETGQSRTDNGAIRVILQGAI